MDLSNSLFSASDNLDVKIRDLWQSEFSEDKEQVSRAELIIKSLVKDLRPILVYLAIPVFIASIDEPRDGRAIEYWSIGGDAGFPQRVKRGDRLVPLGIPHGVLVDLDPQRVFDRCELFLTKEGEWMNSFECNSSPCVQTNGKHYHGWMKGGEPWKDVPFRLVVERLTGVLTEARNQRQQHLAAIDGRLKMFKAIEAILNKK